MEAEQCDLIIVLLEKIAHFAKDENSIKEGRTILISNSVLNALLYYIIRIYGKETGFLTMVKPVTDMMLFGVACSPLAKMAFVNGEGTKLLIALKKEMQRLSQLCTSLYYSIDL